MGAKMSEERMESTAERVRELRRKSAEECLEAINGVLQRHGCKLVAVPMLMSDGRISASVVIEPL